MKHKSSINETNKRKNVQLDTQMGNGHCPFGHRLRFQTYESQTWPTKYQLFRILRVW